MSDISLTASMRSNLLSLQNTQRLMDTTQNRLSTGLKVNSAIDNPSSYYTAQSLNNRAGDLSALMDSMGQGINTLKAADESIKSITKFVEQAKALANTAFDSPSVMSDQSSTQSKYKLSATDTLTSPQTYIIDSRADMSKIELTARGLTAGTDGTIDFYLNGERNTITVTGAVGDSDATAVANLLKTQIENSNSKLSVTIGAAGRLTVTSSDPADNISVVNNGVGPALGNGNTATNQTTSVTSANMTSTIEDLVTTLDGVAMPFDAALVDGKIVLTNRSTTDKAVIYNTSTIKMPEVDFPKAVLETAGTIGNFNRESGAKRFAEILNQVNLLAKDSSYKGVNLLQGNDLKVIFNEDRKSFLDVKGTMADAESLGLETPNNNWQSNDDIMASVTQAEGAINSLREMATEFGNNFSAVQNREEFTKNLVNVLTEGADKLTLADMDEESANMLALQTRQQLAINSLSLASQAAQSVLKLF